CLCCFFFSSRRRHTRSKRDWSSDVCSSDLSSLGAVSISGAIIFTVLAFVVGLNNAALTILSQQKGLKSEVGLINYLNAFVVILIVMSFTFSLFGFIFAEPLLL